ncbi:transglycosylase domain-containing protein [Arthrobacter sp. Y-9]|uniref:transglycosylase domain-containing protein n=1 Tax=Arthrobacter sp. Y-9 TaxID=3039385 RepID=UPI00241D1779|nr:transglycosylase domain-containing protein [Arthrobacter sp. Y-9]WFR85356.1 transglycosylase domain-containing protein [Arthrobacter sp. Y-9]
MRSEPPNHSWQAARTGRIEAQRGLPSDEPGASGYHGGPESQGTWPEPQGTRPEQAAPPRGRRPRREKRSRGAAPSPAVAPPARPARTDRRSAPRGTQVPGASTLPDASTKPPRRRKAFKRVLVSIAVLLVVQFLSVLSYNWFTPPRTSYMFQSGEPIVYQYVSIDHISRFALAATIAHEDEQLGTRVGAFTWEELTQRAEAWQKGEKDPSGSTIPQQLVKNIYLWPSQDPVRKSLEAGLATEMSLTVPAKRVLELYLNYAQFAPKLYGICAASWYYYNTPPWAMTEHQAGQLMGVLPLPERVRRAPEGGIDLGPSADPLAWDLINGAANVWVPRQIEGMGGWQATVATVGINDLASDHAAERNSGDSCSTMPAAVSKRIAEDAAGK